MEYRFFLSKSPNPGELSIQLIAIQGPYLSEKSRFTRSSVLFFLKLFPLGRTEDLCLFKEWILENKNSLQSAFKFYLWNQ